MPSLPDVETSEELEECFFVYCDENERCPNYETMMAFIARYPQFKDEIADFTVAWAGMDMAWQ
jgi:hypothetical protein